LNLRLANPLGHLFEGGLFEGVFIQDIR